MDLVVTGSLLAASAAALGMVHPRAKWPGPLISAGPRTGNRVALTFDDGPNDPHTLRAREILDAHGTKGTFFCVGKAIDARPDIAKSLLDHGHLLGNHSYDHRWGSAFAASYPELGRADATFRGRLGVSPAFFRPPYGTHTPYVARVVAGAGMRLVTWDVMAWDWITADSAKIARRILRSVKPGSIILLHDGCDGDLTTDRAASVGALPAILAGLAERGLQPVRLDELLGGPAYLGSPGAR